MKGMRLQINPLVRHIIKHMLLYTLQNYCRRFYSQSAESLIEAKSLSMIRGEKEQEVTNVYTKTSEVRVERRFFKTPQNLTLI